MKKLKLKKETIISLDNLEMANIKGGFTYSLSTGERCQESKALTAKNGYDCGLIKKHNELNQTVIE
ncbi:MAG: class I lanthipeptide [Chryseotalea sp.]|jgi:natural product precursor